MLRTMVTLPTSMACRRTVISLLSTAVAVATGSLAELGCHDIPGVVCNAVKETLCALLHAYDLAPKKTAAESV